MRPLRTTALGLALAALTGACMSGYYSAPIRSNAVTGARWQDPSYFKTQARSRADFLATQVRRDVDTGHVPPQALGDLRAQRAQLDAVIDAAGADGAIDVAERRQVESMLDRMGRTGRRWGGPRVYGGGPRVFDRAGEELYEHNWRRLY